MGSGIAEVAAQSGFEVVIRSRSQSGADAAVGRIAKSLAKQGKKGKVTDDERDETLGRVRPTDDLGEFELCDIVIESVIEELDTKRQLFKELDRICSPNAIFATNTSTLPVVE